MVGHKSSLNALKSELEKAGVASSAQTEFCQGHTTRWGFAWTFLSELNFEVLPKIKKKEKPPMKYVVPMLGNALCYTVNTVTGKLKMLFSQLQVQTFNFCYTASCIFTVFHRTEHVSSCFFVKLINSMKQSP